MKKILTISLLGLGLITGAAYATSDDIDFDDFFGGTEAELDAIVKPKTIENTRLQAFLQDRATPGQVPRDEGKVEDTDLTIIKADNSYIGKFNAAGGQRFWDKYLEENTKFREIIVAYSENGRDKFKLFLNKEVYQADKETSQRVKATFSRSVVAGLIYKTKDYPYTSQEIARLINQGKIRSDGQGGVQMDIEKKKPYGYLFYSQFAQSNRGYTIVPAESITLDSEPWVEAMLKEAISQDLYPDHRNVGKKVHEVWADYVSQLRVGLQKLYRLKDEMRKAYDSAQRSGKGVSDYVVYEKVRPGSDKYKYLEKTSQSITTLLPDIKVKSFIEMAGLIHVDGFEQAKAKFKNEVDQYSQKLQLTNYQRMVNDSDPNSGVLKPVVRLIRALDTFIDFMTQGISKPFIDRSKARKNSKGLVGFHKSITGG